MGLDVHLYEKAQHEQNERHMADIKEFRLTFGQRYAREQHPAFVEGRLDFEPHPDGWLTVLAPDYDAARVHVVGLLGPWWSDLMDMRREDDHYYPRGELARLEVPA